MMRDAGLEALAMALLDDWPIGPLVLPMPVPGEDQAGQRAKVKE